MHLLEINDWCLKVILFLGLFQQETGREILNQYIAKQTEDGKIVFKCTMCEKTNNRKHHIINHVESVHFPNLFRYSCHYCEKEYKTKNSLDVHLSTVHRGDKQHLRQFVWNQL